MRKKYQFGCSRYASPHHVTTTSAATSAVAAATPSFSSTTPPPTTAAAAAALKATAATTALTAIAEGFWRCLCLSDVEERTKDVENGGLRGGR